MNGRHWIADVVIGTVALAAMPVVWGMSLAPLSLLGQAMPVSLGAPAGVAVMLFVYGISVYAAIRFWTFLVECSELGWRGATPPKKWTTVAVSIFAVVSIASWAVIVERRLALEQSLSIEGPANKPLQPTRAAEPYGQRESAGSGPRG